MDYLKTLGQALNKEIKTSTKQQTIDTCDLIYNVAWAMYIKSENSSEWKVWQAIQNLTQAIKEMQ